jgi:5-methyltetrahydrofolate--homocysteine methyltransferase
MADYANELFAADAYRGYLEVHGLGVQLTEALAEYRHRRIRQVTLPGGVAVASEDPQDVEEFFELGYRGARFSPGVKLSEEYQLHPEQPTDAIVCHHPEAKYFNT